MYVFYDNDIAIIEKINITITLFYYLSRCPVVLSFIEKIQQNNEIVIYFSRIKVQLQQVLKHTAIPELTNNLLAGHKNSLEAQVLRCASPSNYFTEMHSIYSFKYEMFLNDLKFYCY